MCENVCVVCFGCVFALTIQTSMLRNSSQFFRVSNTREDFRTPTRRCSKLFAFLGPAKPGKMRIWNMFERPQTRIDGIRNHVGWKKSVDYVCSLSWRRWSGHLSTCCKQRHHNLCGHIPPVNWVVPQEAHSPPSSPWRGQLGKFTSLVELWTWLWTTVPQQETRFCHFVCCLGYIMPCKAVT